MTAIERAEALLEAAEIDQLYVVVERAREFLRGYIGAIKALLAEHTLTVDWETNHAGALRAATLAHYNAFRLGQFTTEGCESCSAIADFERLFPEAPASAD